MAQRATLILLEHSEVLRDELGYGDHPLAENKAIVGEWVEPPAAGEVFVFWEHGYTHPRRRPLVTTEIVSLRDDGDEIFFRTKGSTYKLELRRD